ncbi:MAG TPA: hypothetical protein VGT98_02960 [Candidatus Elarobacter sp.]|nr:hypothetical protein [Candidatus Elarobacter sp.]HEV2737522.1 hypothetical protein [Candidatus Elarobacter sp.]
MTGRVSARLLLRSMTDGSIAITVTSPFENERFSVADAALLLTVWAESPDVIRGRFEHRGSGAVAYFQSSDSAWRRLAEIVRLIAPLPN